MKRGFSRLRFIGGGLIVSILALTMITIPVSGVASASSGVSLVRRAHLFCIDER
jgi:hypothetical protein